MKYAELPEWIRKNMEKLGVEPRDYDGGLIEVEFWMHVVADESTKHALDSKALADAVAKYREQVQSLGSIGMITGMVNEATKHR